MPTYPFRCRECGRTAEVVSSISRYLEMEKPKCCGEEMSRVWTPPQIINALTAQPFFHTGLGKVINSRYEESETLKEMNYASGGETNYRKAEKGDEPWRVPKQPVRVKR